MKPSKPLDERAAEQFEREHPPQFVATRVDLSGLSTREFSPPRFVLDPILPRGEVTLLAGHGGAGKSIAALTMAAHIAVGAAWGPFPAVLSPCVYASLEDDGNTLARRLQRICRAYGLDPDAVAVNLALFDCSQGASTTLAFEINDGGVRSLMCDTPGMETVGELSRGMGLIVVDNASDAYDGQENDRREVRAFVRRLRMLARKHDAALLLLAHIDKSAARFGANGNTYSGSTAWHNSVRSRLALADENGAPVLTHEKANLSGLAKPAPLRWTDDGVLVPASADEARAAALAAGQDDDNAVMGAIAAATGRGIIVSAAQSGPATAWHAIAALPELPDDLQTPKDGKRRTLRAVARLEAAGTLRRVSYQNADYKPKERYELAETPPVNPPEISARQSPIPPTGTGGRASGYPPVPARPPVDDLRSTGGLADEPTVIPTSGDEKTSSAPTSPRNEVRGRGVRKVPL